MKTIYTKITDYRGRTTRTETSILVDDLGRKLVRKRAIFPEGVPHVRSTYSNYLYFKKSMNVFSFPHCWMEGNDFFSDFIEGQTLEELLVLSTPQERRTLTGLFFDYLGLILGVDLYNFNLLEKADAIARSRNSLISLDIIPSNIVVSRKQFYLIDYEWIDQAAPAWISLNRIFRSNEFLKLEFKDLISTLDQEQFARYENNFLANTVSLSERFPLRENLGSIGDLSFKIHAKNVELSASNIQLREIQGLMSGLSEEYARFRAEILQSRSWRVTKIFRIIGSYLR